MNDATTSWVLSLGLEPTLRLKDAALIVGLTRGSLRKFLHEHREIPVRYASDRLGRKLRVLFASEVRYVRDHRLSVKNPAGGYTRVTFTQRELYPTIDWSAYVETARKRMPPVEAS